MGVCSLVSVLYVNLATLILTFYYSATFQAAIIFLFNAKGDNPYTSRQGARNLMRCAQAYEREECVKTSRITKVLLSLADRFSVPVVPQPPQRLPTPPPYTDSQTSQDTSFTVMSSQPSINTISTTTNTSNTATNISSTADSSMNVSQPAAPISMDSVYIPYDSGNLIDQTMTPNTDIMQGHQHQEQHPPPGQFGTAAEAQAPPVSVPMIPVGGEPMEFDIANLASEVPLWDIPSGVTWSEWDAFLQTDMNSTR